MFFFLLYRSSANGCTRTVSLYNTDQYVLVFVYMIDIYSTGTMLIACFTLHSFVFLQ